jgi:threonine dehydratase
MVEKEELRLQEVLAAAAVIRPYVNAVPMRRSGYLSERTGASVWLKLENGQPTGSFKIRGALNKLSHLTAAERERGIVAASAGNHGLGVAYAADKLAGRTAGRGLTADIFVPETAPAAKVEKLRRFGVTLHLVGKTYDEAVLAARTFAERTGALEIPAYDDPVVIAGQGTIGLEILQERPETDVIRVPVGGGGMIAGISVVATAVHPDCRVIGVQPAASPAALLSLRDGVAYDPYEAEPTIADGLAGGFGEWPLRIGGPLIDRILLAGEGELRQAVYTLVDREQLVIEASGAAAIVPLLNGSLAGMEGRMVVCVLSGGNLPTGLLAEILAVRGG